jgi:uncharacterized protein YndB with AHSA1/START domain
MNRFEVTREISAPPKKVWEILSDVTHWPEWNSSIQKVVALSPESIRFGSRFLIKQPRLAPLVYEVIVFEPGQLLSWEAQYPGFHLTADHWIVPTHQEDKVELKLVLHQKGWLINLSGLFFPDLIQKYLVLEAEGLQKKAESLLPYPVMAG